MRITGRGMTLRGAEGASPPLPFITVDDEEGDALLALYPKSIRRIGNETGGLTAEEIDAALVPVEGESKEDPADEGGQGDGGSEGDSGDETAAAEARRQAIRDAVELLDAEGLVKTGDRAGKPKVKAVADILGNETGELTAEEIDAALVPVEGE